jgi:ASC-1-like (ASCH) protein
MNHQMKLNPKAFDLIQAGKKDLEVRLYDEKRKQLAVGDTITFYKLPEKVETITKKVIGLVIFANFVDLFKNVDGTRAGWEAGVLPEKMAEHMRKFYSQEQQDEFGVLGIFIC